MSVDRLQFLRDRVKALRLAHPSRWSVTRVARAHRACEDAAREIWEIDPCDKLPTMLLHLVRAVVVDLTRCSSVLYGVAIDRDHTSILSSLRCAETADPEQRAVLKELTQMRLDGVTTLLEPAVSR